ncbi:hypothetical protein Y1Q_0024125 [Alligator mississippiensis]|uniref:Uncharacterized protein n=1 Tax=Alligator mississippiensis TaxID=8496 RepID=A0A151NHZ4_ALLMI|nr:hypothetical protein Y1Q_0024125 [Alligator mississippiensis]
MLQRAEENVNPTDTQADGEGQGFSASSWETRLSGTGVENVSARQGLQLIKWEIDPLLPLPWTHLLSASPHPWYQRREIPQSIG